FFQAEDGIRDRNVTGVQTCALPISTMLLNAVLFLLSSIATGLAGSAGVFIVSRLVGGLAIGAASVLAPMYIAEVAPPQVRGRLRSEERRVGKEWRSRWAGEG